MNSSPRRRRLRYTKQLHLRSPTFPRPILLVLVVLAFALVDNNMYQPIRCFRFLHTKISYGAALTTTNTILLRPQIRNKRVTKDRSFSTLFSARSPTLILASKGTSPFATQTKQTIPKTRLFGSKRGVTGHPLGTVAIYNEQDAIQDIDEEALQTTVERIWGRSKIVLVVVKAAP